MSKINPEHLARSAYVYVRQSTADQLRNNHESRRRQYALADRARLLGWTDVVVIDDDLGVSAGGVARPGFERLLAAICGGQVAPSYPLRRPVSLATDVIGTRCSTSAVWSAASSLMRTTEASQPVQRSSTHARNSRRPPNSAIAKRGYVERPSYGSGPSGGASSTSNIASGSSGRPSAEASQTSRRPVAAGEASTPAECVTNPSTCDVALLMDKPAKPARIRHRRGYGGGLDDSPCRSVRLPRMS